MNLTSLAMSILLGCIIWNADLNATNRIQPVHEAIWDAQAKNWISLTDLAQTFQPGDSVILGEMHMTEETMQDPELILHHDNQMRFLELLHSARGHSVSVGMEFLEYVNQDIVDLFLAGKMTDDDFQQQANWSRGNPFSVYREPILFPASSGGVTVALNAPSALPRQVARNGKDSLSAEQKLLLPPRWERGREPYFARFKEALGGHGTEAQVENYFWAQSLWDSTMAWNIEKSITKRPEDIFVTIVGEFHMLFRGGLPFELHKLTPRPIFTVLQIHTDKLDIENWAELVQPDAIYGAKADFIWVSTATSFREQTQKDRSGLSLIDAP